MEGASEWCDIRQSSQVESCNEIAQLALDEALAGLSAEYGGEIGKWRWGDAHKAMHDHSVLGRSGLFSPLVNIRQSTSGGEHTLNRGFLRPGWRGSLR